MDGIFKILTKVDDPGVSRIYVAQAGQASNNIGRGRSGFGPVEFEIFIIRIYWLNVSTKTGRENKSQSKDSCAF